MRITKASGRAARTGIPTLVRLIVIVAGTAIAILTRPVPPERARVGDIIRDPNLYAGRAVTIAGKYGGWSYGGDVPVTDQGPPVTKSDWAVYDDSGGIYVQANGAAEILESAYPGTLNPMDPSCLGTDLVVRGTVKISDEGVPYIG